MKLPDIVYKISKEIGIASKPVLWDFPREVDVGLTNFCNLNCSFCLNDKIKKKRGFIQETLFRSLADCLSERFKAKTIMGLGLFGEATLHPNFADFLKYASSRGLKINISTNFVGVDQTLSRAMIDNKMNLIEISFYTFDKERYQQLVRRNEYDRVLENIHSFLALAEKNNFRGGIRLRPFRDFGQQRAVYQREFYQKYPGLNFENAGPKTMVNWAGFLDLPQLLKGTYLRTPCSFPFSRMVVDWDGEVKLCCESMLAEDLVVGYANESLDLYDLWNGEKLNEIREKFSKIDYKDFPSCRNCYFSRRYFPLRKE